MCWRGQLSDDLGLKQVSQDLYTVHNGMNVVAKLKPTKKEVNVKVNMALKVWD